MRDRVVRILSAGDLHIGRFPSKIPVDDPACSVKTVWSNLVDLAIERAVDAVVLNGDVIDEENRRFEAFGPLQRGVRRLAEADIDTIAIAGNHDHAALPRLHRLIDADRFHLLGQGGRWEEHVVRSDGDDLLRVFGWSFPERHVHASPVPELSFEDKALPTVATIHGELGVADSPYVPLTAAELTAAPVDAWLLGHVHKPGVRREEPLVLYPGSLQPLDPSEEGPRGPWLVEIGHKGDVRAEQVPLASLAYASLEVGVDEDDQAEDLEGRLVVAIRSDLTKQREINAHLRRAVYRITLVGRSRHHQHLVQEARTLVRGLTVPHEVVDAHIEAIETNLRPPVDLKALADQRNPAGVLARHLLRLEQGEAHEATGRLIDRLRENAKTVRQSTGYAALDGHSELEEAALRQEALRQGRLFLDELLSQKNQ